MDTKCEIRVGEMRVGEPIELNPICEIVEYFCKLIMVFVE